MHADLIASVTIWKCYLWVSGWIYSGCYDGALDSQWGPASRAALAAFKTQSGSGGEALAGTEPGRALLDAVRGLLPAVTCR